MKRVLALQLGSLFPQQHRLRYLLHSDHHHCEVIGSRMQMREIFLFLPIAARHKKTCRRVCGSRFYNYYCFYRTCTASGSKRRRHFSPTA